MSDNSNIWYLDRGKNFFTEEGKELFNTVINVVNTYSYLAKMTSSELIEKFPQKMKKSANPNALLTTARNIGIINKENKLGKNIQYYLNDQLTYKELIFENLTKVNYDKESSYPVKPFVVICKALYRLYTLDRNEAYITKADCIKYLYNITDYFQITNEYCINIIKNRSFEKESGEGFGNDAPEGVCDSEVQRVCGFGAFVQVDFSALYGIECRREGGVGFAAVRFGFGVAGGAHRAAGRTG